MLKDTQMNPYSRPKAYGFCKAFYNMENGWRNIFTTQTKHYKTKVYKHTDCLRRHTAVSVISELIYINVKHLTSSTVKKSTGVHLGLITKLIESNIFLSGF